MWYLAWFIASLIVGLMGNRSNIGFWGFFFLSLFFSPVVGFAVLVVAAPRGVPSRMVREELVDIEVRERGEHKPLS